MQAEFLREPLTALGGHYLLIHFDGAAAAGRGLLGAVDDRVNNATTVSLEALKARQVIHQAVTHTGYCVPCLPVLVRRAPHGLAECAGTGRSTLHPRAVYVPWFKEAIGT